MPQLIFYLISLCFLPLRIVGQPQQCAASGTYNDCCPGSNNQFVIFQSKEYKVFCDQGIVYGTATAGTQDPKACAVFCNADPKCINAYWSSKKACVTFKLTPQAGNVALVADMNSDAVSNAISSERAACATKIAAAVASGVGVAVSQCQSTERAACATRVANAISTEQAACGSRISSAVSTEKASCTSKISAAISTEQAACATRVSNAISTEKAACGSRISSAVSTEKVSCTSKIFSAIATERAACTTKVSMAVSSAISTERAACATRVSNAISTERAACKTKVSKAVGNAVSTAKKACQTKVTQAVKKCKREEKIKCDKRVQAAACNKCKTKPPVTKPPVINPGGGYNQASISQICGQPSIQNAAGRRFAVWAGCQGSGPHLNGFDGQPMNSNQDCMAACARDSRCRMAHKFDSRPGPKYKNACFIISQITLVARDPKATLMLPIG